MRLEAITMREIRMPLVHFFETSFGRTTQRRILLIKAQFDGISSWGECVAGEHPFYSEESIDTAWYAIEKELAPAILGKQIEQGTDCQAIFARVRGHRMAKAALENAVWEAEAKAKRIPLWRLLGGERTEIPCGVSIGIQDSPEQLLDKIAGELEAGYQRIKVKCKPGWDVEIFKQIRKRWPDILLSCDANSVYRMEDFPLLQEFDQFRLLMIEQPLWHDDFYFHSRLQKMLKTPICLDEAIRTARDARAAIDLAACGIINIKVGRVGGFTEAREVHDVAQQHRIPVWCGGMLESGIGRVHNIAISTLKNFTLPGDVSASNRYWKEDIVEPDIKVSKRGVITVKDEPGMGYQVREDLIEKLTVRHVTLKQ